AGTSNIQPSQSLRYRAVERRRLSGGRQVVARGDRRRSRPVRVARISASDFACPPLPSGMAAGERHPLLTGTLVTSAGTLVSRVLGLVRDMVTAGLFGLAAGGVLDALVVAFRIPNLFRALFGEGALTASYLPVFATALQRDRPSAWSLFRAVNRWLAAVL